MRYFYSISSLVLLLLFVKGCEKTEGYGGTSTISGTIITTYYNDDYSELIKESPAVDEDVFLLFGDSEIVGDKVSTGPGGAFKFEYLRPGNYTVYFMSEDSTSAETKEQVVSFDVELLAAEDKDLGTLTEIKSLDYDEGTAKISGVIRLINYKNSSQYPFLEVKDTSFAQDYEVYLIYGTHTYYDERIRTSYDGSFEFNHLIPGNYIVFTFSEDVKGATEDITIIREITIEEEDQEIQLDEIIVEQL